MKNTITLLFLGVSAFAFSQEIISTPSGKTVKLNPDKTWEYVTQSQGVTKDELKFNEKGVAAVMKNIQMKNGKNEIVNVDFTGIFKKEDVDTFQFSKFNEMIDRVGVEAKYKLKNKVSFLPLKINLLKMDSNWTYMINYSGSNDYGAEKDTSSIVYFDETGNFVKSL